MIAFVAIDIMKECLSDHFSLASLGVSVASDVAQATLAAGAGIVAGVLASSFLPVVVTFVIVVGGGFLAGIMLLRLDERFQLTERARARLMAMEKDTGSLLYRAEHGAAAAGHEAVKFGSEGITAARYAANRLWISIDAMLKSDGDDGQSDIPLWQMAP